MPKLEKKEIEWNWFKLLHIFCAILHAPIFQMQQKKKERTHGDSKINL